MAVNHDIGLGSLYALDPNLMLRRRIERVGMPKDVAFDGGRRRLHFADIAEKAVFRFDYDLSTGRIADHRVFPTTRRSPASLMGLRSMPTIISGSLLGGWRVCRYDPDSRRVAELILLVPMRRIAHLVGRI